MEMVYEKVKLFRKQMEILIPEGFKDMPDYVARKKYPSKHRPPVILMDKNNMVNFNTSLERSKANGLVTVTVTVLLSLQAKQNKAVIHNKRSFFID